MNILVTRATYATSIIVYIQYLCIIVERVKEDTKTVPFISGTKNWTSEALILHCIPERLKMEHKYSNLVKNIENAIKYISAAK